MKKRRSIWIWVILFLVIVALGVTLYLFARGTSNNITASELQQYAQYNGLKINNAVLEPNTNGIMILTGTYIIDGKEVAFRCVVDSQMLAGDDWFKTLINGISLSYSTGSGWTSILISLVPILLYMGVMIWLFRAMSRGGGAGMFGPQTQTRPRESKSTVKFSDVAGSEEEKQEMYELVDYLKQPNKYAQYGARVPKGILMEGPPGTGKTLLAKAVAGEAGVSFFSMAGSEFEEMFVGLGASRVRSLFADAKKAAPCIIFIDEIDAVGRKRGNSMGSGTTEQTLNQLLVEMDGFETNAGVIVMAATNRVDVLDSALLRPGRFDRTIQISLPDIKERTAILKLHARNKNVSSDVEWKRIAERTPGFSGAQLENVLNEAAILIVRNKKKIITIIEIDEAIDRVVGGPAKKSRVMTVQDKQIVSYHEAGHALIGLKLESASKVQKVTIIPRGNAGGYTIMTPKDESNFSSKDDLYASITGYLGGRAAEEIIFGKNKITTGAHDDLDKATNIAKRMVTQFGMSSLGLTKYITIQEDAFGQNKGSYSDDVAAKIDAEIAKMLDKCFVSSLAIINANREELELIAESLRILETITAEQIDYIDKHMALPKEVLEEKERKVYEDEKRAKGEILEIEPDKDDGKDKAS